jgi:hypothetical protein
MCGSCGYSQSPEEEEKKEKYECEGCGRKSEEQEDCCNKQMKEIKEC